jgi:hypothetical protein
MDVEFDFKRNPADQNRAVWGRDDKATKVWKPYIERAPLVGKRHAERTKTTEGHCAESGTRQETRVPPRRPGPRRRVAPMVRAR